MVFVGFFLLLLSGGWIVIQSGRALSAGLIGVVLNRDEMSLSFPSDGVLRSFDLFTVLNSIIPARIETIPLASVKGWSRQAGVTLLIHGDFGSHAITFSDKLRRDQLLKFMNGYRGFSDLEMVGGGDYA
jgi:hypothetical protein